jgi:nucleoside-diphosphate-sugar epimerase
VADVLAALCRAAGVRGPRGRVPWRAAWVAGAAAEGVWSVTGRESVPPMTRFLAEQLSTAHWFDQRRTRSLLGWTPAVTLDEGFARLAEWYALGERGSPSPTAGSRLGG